MHTGFHTYTQLPWTINANNCQFSQPFAIESKSIAIYYILVSCSPSLFSLFSIQWLMLSRISLNYFIIRSIYKTMANNLNPIDAFHSRYPVPFSQTRSLLRSRSPQSLGNPPPCFASFPSFN